MYVCTIMASILEELCESGSHFLLEAKKKKNGMSVSFDKTLQKCLITFFPLKNQVVELLDYRPLLQQETWEP